MGGSKRAEGWGWGAIVFIGRSEAVLGLGGGCESGWEAMGGSELERKVCVGKAWRRVAPRRACLCVCVCVCDLLKKRRGRRGAAVAKRRGGGSEGERDRVRRERERERRGALKTARAHAPAE